jgi:tetratricopeptide (TPR) repeat protein
MGLYLALGALGQELLGRMGSAGPRRALAGVLLVLPLAALVPVQQRQLATWATPFSQAEQALAVTSGNYMLYYNYGVLKAGQGERDLAEGAYLKSLEIFSDYGPALNNLGVLRLQQGRVAEALAPLERAVEANLKHGSTYGPRCSLGLCLFLLGRPAEAQHQFALAIQERPELPRAYHDWGNLARDMGDFELARELYAKALEAYPNWDLALRNLDKLEKLAAARRR